MAKRDVPIEDRVAPNRYSELLEFAEKIDAFTRLELFLQ